MARDRSLSDVSGSIGGVEAGDEEVEFDREEKGLTFECCSVAKRGREILGWLSPQYGRWMCTSLLEDSEVTNPAGLLYSWEEKSLKQPTMTTMRT